MAMLTKSNSANGRRLAHGLVAALVVAVVAMLVAGVGTESTPLIVAGAVGVAVLVPARRWILARYGLPQDERTRTVSRTATSRAMIALFAVAWTVTLAGVVADAVEWSMPAALLDQARPVAHWSAAAVIGSSLVHAAIEWWRGRRLEA
ncbi:MAG: hypothetical protein ABEJ86_00835 [Halococcoides sp.]